MPEVLFTEIPTAIVALFALMNPFPLLGIYIALTKNHTKQNRKHLLIVMVIAINLVLFAFLYTGTEILNFFGIDIAGFTVAGGFVILLIGLSMIRSDHSQKNEQQNNIPEHLENPNPISVGIVPLTIPILAGPGTISTVINLSNTFNSVTGNIAISIAIIVVTLFVFVAFSFAPIISSKLGKTGLSIITKIMGLILMALAFDMLAKGITGLFPALS